MISDNDPFVRAVASRLQRGLLAICVNDERMAGDSVRLTKGELYEIAPAIGGQPGDPGWRAYCVNSCGWQHADHFEIIKIVRCVRSAGEKSLRSGKMYDVEGGYFYDQNAYVWLNDLQAEHEGRFALAWGGFRFDRFEVEGCSCRCPSY